MLYLSTCHLICGINILQGRVYFRAFFKQNDLRMGFAINAWYYQIWGKNSDHFNSMRAECGRFRSNMIGRMISVSLANAYKGRTMGTMTTSIWSHSVIKMGKVRIKTADILQSNFCL